jgi:hypothetical protein
MKKGWILFILFVDLLIYITIISAETNITGEAVTGKALESSLALNITVTVPMPILTILSPKNETYLTNESLLINYMAINTNSLWYNLDSGTNTSLTGPTYVNVTQGSHILYIYANNTYGITPKNVSFIANSTFFLILYEEYKGSNKGNSTDFIKYTYEDLQDLSGIVLENTAYGKIRFNEIINVTNDKLNTDNILDLDSNTQISQNSIQLNSGEIPNFNTSATLWLYNLPFNTPRILKDGAVCPPSVCVKESYSGGVLKFYVTHFTNYSAEETPSTPPPTPPPSGGGGGAPREQQVIEEVTPEAEDNFTFIPKEIKISLKPGETDTQDVYIINNYDKALGATIEVSGIDKFVKITESEVALNPGEMKAIRINFFIPENTPPDTYVGRIIVREPSGKIYESLITIDVPSVGSLFDVALKLDESRLPARPGGYVLFKTMIYNLGENKNISIVIKYTIKDSYGKVIFEGEGAENIESYLEKDGKIKLPKDTPPGRYILSVKVNYGEKTAVSSANFDIETHKTPLIWKLLIIIGTIIIIFVILWLIGKREEKKTKKEIQKKEDRMEY